MLRLKPRDFRITVEIHSVSSLALKSDNYDPNFLIGSGDFSTFYCLRMKK